jgi:hypothetical protein
MAKKSTESTPESSPTWGTLEAFAREGIQNCCGRPRRLSMLAGTLTLRRPRVRGLEERFESRLLPLLKRRTEEVGNLLPEV